jgi:hypothetical protein
MNLARVLALKTSPLERQIEYAKLQYWYGPAKDREGWKRTYDELIARADNARMVSPHRSRLEQKDGTPRRK